MILFIECVVACAVFTLIIVPSVKKNPLKWSYDYPPSIQTRLKELGLVTSDKLIVSKQVILRKLVIAIITAILLAVILFYINGSDSFISGFVYSGIIWLSVTWYDGIILDCLWFCHEKSIIIKGTEDMVSEYHNYGYHLIASCKGTLMGIPACAAVGGIVTLIGYLF